MKKNIFFHSTNAQEHTAPLFVPKVAFETERFSLSVQQNGDLSSSKLGYIGLDLCCGLLLTGA